MLEAVKYHHPLAVCKKISESKLAEKNPHWSGDKVGYTGLHRWVSKRIPKPKKCQICHKDKSLDLSNKGIYDRNLENWEWLCRKCHMEKDGRLDTFKKCSIGRKPWNLGKTFKGDKRFIHKKQFKKGHIPWNKGVKKNT